MDGDQEGGPGEDGNLAGQLLYRGAPPTAGLVPCPQDDEGVTLELLMLGQVLRVEAVLHRRSMETVLLRNLRELLLGGGNQVHPDEGRIALLDHRLERHARQIRLAAAAAPKPLSMFTTVTPAAQELSIPRSAASPPKEAPYPTLVGTAMTGTATRPPTTLGSAPSIPATTITTRACRNTSPAAS